MSCSPFDLRDYWLNELSPSERGQVDAHLRICEACGEEMRRLQATETALLSLRDEDVPQRIGFVSDKVFEPSPVRRWLAGFWASSARLAFASAAMLSVAILVHAVAGPRPPAPVPQAAPNPRAALVQLEADFERRLQAAVERAVAESDRRASAALAAAERRHELDRQGILLAVEENLNYMRKRLNVMIRAGADYGAQP